MSSIVDFFDILFNEGENICVSNNKYAYHSVPIQTFRDGKVNLLSSNPDLPVFECSSSDLILVAINPINGFREDKNCTSLRSFLLEIDTGEIKDQLIYIKKLGIPFSAQVFSGNRSVHTVITLDEDIKEYRDYKLIYQWILNIVTLADQNCKNPSRSIRIPGAYREPGKQQTLISLNKRISHKELFEWLNRYQHLRPKPKERKRQPIAGSGDFSKLSPWAKNMLKYGIKFNNGRNHGWYGFSRCFKDAGFTYEETLAHLETLFVEEHDFKEKEFLIAVKSAFKDE